MGNGDEFAIIERLAVRLRSGSYLNFQDGRG